MNRAAQNMTTVQRMDRRFYPQLGDQWDDRMFREHVLEHVSPEHDVLDLGAGAGIVAAMNLHGRAKRVVGLDPDPRVATNAFLDEGIVGDAERMPFPDESFDVVFSDNVLEHLERPQAVFREVTRVLRRGGVFLAKTPNRWHYVTIGARLTPHRFHGWVNLKRGRAHADTFPTRYRANGPRALRRLARDAGLEVQAIRLIEGRPEYLRKWPAAYLLGVLYERIVNSTPLLRVFRVVIIASFRKPT
jgi:SAM-dependent methyltransferase